MPQLISDGQTDSDDEEPDAEGNLPPLRSARLDMPRGLRRHAFNRGAHFGPAEPSADELAREVSS